MKRILLIDEDRDFIEYFKEICKELKIDLEQSSKIAEAKSKLAHSSFDSLIVEKQVSDGSGKELAQWIRASANQIPIVFLCSPHYPVKEMRSLKQEISNCYIVDKPLFKKDALLLINELLEKNTDSLKTIQSKIPPEMQEMYRKTICDKLEQIETLIKKTQVTRSQEDAAQLRQCVHKIAGSAGSYGYDRAGLLCRGVDVELAKLLGPSCPLQLDSEYLKSLNDFFRTLKLYFQLEH